WIMSGTIRVVEYPSFLEEMIPLLALIISCIFIVRTPKDTVCLSDSAISVIGFPGNKLLPFDKIAGRRRYFERHGEGKICHIVLEPSEDRYPQIDISEEAYPFDDDFYRWFDNLRDLDEGKRR